MADHRIQTTFRIDPDLLKKFRHELLDSDMKMTPVIEKLIRQWLSGHKYEREQILLSSEPRILPPESDLRIEAKTQAVTSVKQQQTESASQSPNSVATQGQTESTPQADSAVTFPNQVQTEAGSQSSDSTTAPVTEGRTGSTALTHPPSLTSAKGQQTELTGEMTNLWDTFLKRVKARVSSNTFTTWFQPTRLNRVEGDNLFIQIPSAVFRQVLTRTYGDIIKAVFHEIGRRDIKVQYVCADEEPLDTAATAQNVNQVKLDFESSANQLNLRYTFDSFVVGKSNEFAHAASRAVAEQPSKAYNPLFLYGGVGMGKTHLMHAIGHTIKKRNPAMRLSYVSAEKFTIEVINSLRFDRMISFRERFHTVDVLLVDDIQFIAGKERTQEEFFHTFNALYEQQKQIVISSDCLPKDIDSIEERLRSRFEWGLIADIQPPDLESKVAILLKKAENDRFILPDDVAEYIARAIKSNVRELEGALTRLMAYTSMTGAAISLATAQQVLRNIIASQEKRITIDLIQKRVSEHFDLREKDLKARGNSRAISFPRQVAMYIVKQLTTASLGEIGRQFGGKHSSTVLHSINKIEKLRRSDKDLNRTITRLTDALN